MISAQKSTNNLIWGHLYMMSSFSLAAFKILFVFGFWQFDYNVSWCGSFGFVLWKLWTSWICRVVSFLKFWKYSAICSLNNLCTPFSSGTPIMYILVLSMVSHKFLKFYSFFFILFLYRLNNFKWPLCKPTDSSSYLSHLLNPSSKYFNSVIVFSALEFLFKSFLYFFFVDIFILFIYHFSDFLSSLGFPSAWAHLRHLL